MLRHEAERLRNRAGPVTETVENEIDRQLEDDRDAIAAGEAIPFPPAAPVSPRTPEAAQPVGQPGPQVAQPDRDAGAGRAAAGEVGLTTELTPEGEQSGHCLWCDQPYMPRTNGGKPQRFCSKDCRQDFYGACRDWAAAEVEAGRVSVSTVRTARNERARCVERDLLRNGPPGCHRSQEAP